MIDRSKCLDGPGCNLTTRYEFEGISYGKTNVVLTSSDLSGQLCYNDVNQTGYTVSTYWNELEFKK